MRIVVMEIDHYAESKRIFKDSYGSLLEATIENILSELLEGINHIQMIEKEGRSIMILEDTYGEMELSEELSRLFHTYTDLKNPRTLTSAIVRARAEAPVNTTFRLVEAARKAISPQREKKDLAQVFQALRIEVNDEMEALKALLGQAAEVLRPGGRLAVITYHSIEDRMVKNFIRSGNVEGIVDKDFYGRVSTPWKQVNRSPVVPSEEEVERNPRARSAKLRVAELL